MLNLALSVRLPTIFSSNPCSNSRIWSGAATASYRLLPHIILDEANPVPPHLATRFQNCFAPGVINVDAQTKKVTVDEYGVRGEPMSREVLRHPDLGNFVKLARVRDHFICAFSFLTW
jgi:DNA-directed RNA polymerase I and III subunit RPAC1